MTVKDHIDAPLLKTIAMMNLWGLRTTWCCVGWGYENEKVKKDHAVCLQIFIHADSQAVDKITRFLDTDEMTFVSNLLFFRFVKQSRQQPMIVLTGPARDPNGMWQKEGSPHAHEYPNMIIDALNRRLLNFVDEFASSATIHDQNAVAKETMPHWSYEPSADWTFTKEEILSMP
jgi:hypothetical protein